MASPPRYTACSSSDAVPQTVSTFLFVSRLWTLLIKNTSTRYLVPVACLNWRYASYPIFVINCLLAVVYTYKIRSAYTQNRPPPPRSPTYSKPLLFFVCPQALLHTVPELNIGDGPEQHKVGTSKPLPCSKSCLSKTDLSQGACRCTVGLLRSSINGALWHFFLEQIAGSKSVAAWYSNTVGIPVSYTHLTLPTICSV